MGILNSRHLKPAPINIIEDLGKGVILETKPKDETKPEEETKPDAENQPIDDEQAEEDK
jgi:hypothetical protein